MVSGFRREKISLRRKDYDRLKMRLYDRLEQCLKADHKIKDSKRLIKRLKRHKPVYGVSDILRPGGLAEKIKMESVNEFPRGGGRLIKFDQ